MPVKIMYENDTLAEIDPSCLDELISSKKIKKILRSDGWASVATAPMRGRRRRYEGPERRRFRGEVLSLRSPYNLRKSASDQLHPDSASRHMDVDAFYCPACGLKCEEQEILDGSGIGISLLMKCTKDMCGKYFMVTYDGHNWVESVTAIHQETMEDMMPAARDRQSNLRQTPSVNP